MMPLRRRITRRALSDLRQIQAYSEKKWGAARAARYIDEVYAVMARLAAHPDRASGRKPRGAPFRLITARQHLIVYEVIGESLVILTVLHQMQDIESHLANLTAEFRKEIADIQGRS